MFCEGLPSLLLSVVFLAFFGVWKLIILGGAAREKNISGITSIYFFFIPLP